MTPFAKGKSLFCLLLNSYSLHLHAFHYIYLQIQYLFTWCLSVLRSDCNHAQEVSYRPLLPPLHYSLVTQVVFPGCVCHTDISFESSVSVCFRIGQGGTGLSVSQRLQMRML